ncbi:MAG: aminotransferase class V-fold PLP-dependent enzyme, partial [Balneolaceae bacterium]
GRIPAEIIIENISPRTKVVSVSAVQFLSGYKTDLKSIGKYCRENDIFLVVDGIQALGADEINVEEMKIDALASGGLKWLMAPLGVGFLYLNDRTLKNFTPVRTGWFSVEDPWDLLNYNQPWLKNALRLEDGTPNMLGITGLNASLKTLLDIGILNISRHIQMLTSQLIEMIQSEKKFQLYTSIKSNERAGIITFKTREQMDSEKLIMELKQENISVSFREGFIRMAPHYYNTPEEVHIAFEEIRKRI